MADEHGHIIVIGASAGGISSLLRIVERLPAGLHAAVLVVVHIGQNPSMLPQVLSRATPLPCTHAVDGELIRPGHLYVAPPDYHLLVQGNRLKLSHGPREHHTRPAIDPLFISASRSFGAGTIGIVLSGALSDGAAGSLAIKSRGGRLIVQDPKEALNPGMPKSALQSVDADAVLPANDIADAVSNMIAVAEIAVRGKTMVIDQEGMTVAHIREDFQEQEHDQRAGKLTPFTCPDCGGTLWQSTPDDLLNFRCHVGHAWSWEALVGQKSDELETALWASVRLMVERATLNRQVSARANREGNIRQSERFKEQADRDEEYASLIRKLLESFENYPVEDVPETTAVAE
jgi:two-component system chemotaxis response regulator CheB